MSPLLERRPWLAAVTSVVVPGLGHWMAGRRRTAAWLFALDILVIGAMVAVVLWYQVEAIQAWVSPTALLGILVVDVLALLLRAWVTVDAHLAAGGSWAHPFAIAVLGVVLVLPHAALGYVAYTQYDLVTTVFAASEGPEPPAVPATTTVGPTPATVANTVPSPTTTTTTLPPTTTTTTVPALWDGLDRLNIVLLGADGGVGRWSIRTDTTIVLSIDPSSGDVAMFSVPRDFSAMPLPAGMGRFDCNCFPDIFTNLYVEASRNPQDYPGPDEAPFNAIKGALGELFGMPIHYHAMVTLDGFVAMVDALGGVTIDVPERVVDETYPHEDGSTERVVIEAGRQELDGHLALAYARIRRHSDDFDRMNRQRCVLEAVVEQTSPVELLARFGAVAEAAKEHVVTDIPQDRLADFVELLPRIDTGRIATLRITRAAYQSGGAPGRVYYDTGRIFADAWELMTNPDAAQDRLGLDSLDATCGTSAGA
jgi:LCP family protein required for cell wall assembly